MFKYSMVVGLSLALVALRPLSVSAVFILLSIAIVAGVVEVVPPRPQPYRRRSTRRSHPAVAAVGPWRAGNRAGRFSRSLEGVVAFMNTASLLLLAFNLAAIEGATDPNR